MSRNGVHSFAELQSEVIELQPRVRPKNRYARHTMAGIYKTMSVRSGQSMQSLREVVEMFLGELRHVVTTHGRISVPGLGSFFVRQHKPKLTYAPPGKQGVFSVPSRKLVKFRQAKGWR